MTSRVWLAFITVFGILGSVLAALVAYGVVLGGLRFVVGVAGATKKLLGRLPGVSLVLLALLFGGCVVHAPLPGDGRRVSFVAPTMGGTSLVLFNNIRNVRMDCEIVGPVHHGDVVRNASAVTSDSAKFFLGNQALRDRREVNILCSFSALEAEEGIAKGAYLGVRQFRISLRNRGGEYESEVIEVNRYDQPRRVSLRD